jgi:hypothetical protein
VPPCRALGDGHGRIEHGASECAQSSFYQTITRFGSGIPLFSSEMTPFWQKLFNPCSGGLVPALKVENRTTDRNQLKLNDGIAVWVKASPSSAKCV